MKQKIKYQATFLKVLVEVEKMNRYLGFIFILSIIMLFACEKESVVSNQPITQHRSAKFLADNEHVKKIVSSVSKDSLQAYVKKLVSFYTRHTNTDTISNENGIGAARRWIFNKFRKTSMNLGGRLEVLYDDFVETIRGITGLIEM